jgi:hypothetical protein
MICCWKINNYRVLFDNAVAAFDPGHEPHPSSGKFQYNMMCKNNPIDAIRGAETS